jgi:tetratricopeptide (TPR) repeat protein
MSLSRIGIAVIVCALLSCSAYANGALEHDLDVANDLYQKGDYAGAVENYLKLVVAGVDNPVLHYNLGNSYFKTGQLGLAIAMYNRALRLDPRNDDIKANLTFAKQFMVDKVDPTAENPIWRWCKSAVLNYTANEWTVLTSILFVITVLILTYMIWARDRRFSAKTVVSVAIVVFIVCGVCTGVNVHLSYNSPRGAIVVPEVSIKAGPGEDFGEQFIAHEGLTFNILKQESGWYHGIFDNRLKGWIRISDAVKI